jgi:hypothetical protein
MDRDLIGRVTGWGALALFPLAAAAAHLAGIQGLLGVLAGGGLAVVNFRWLNAGSRRALALFSGGRVHPLWLLGLGARHLSLFGALGVLLWSGHVHPLWLAAGLSVLPPVLIVQAFRAAARSS